jgi:Zn-dependent protease with chaperone function
MRRFPYLAPLLILVALPAVGIVCTLIIDTIYDLERIRAACSIPEIQQELESACADVEQIYLLRDASLLALLASLFILLIYHGVAILVGRNRLLVAIVFSTLVKLSILFTVALVLIDASIFIFSLYWSFALTISQIPIGLLAAVGLGALFAALGLLRSIFALGRRLELAIVGKRLALSDSDSLIGGIRSIATKMGARPPDHVVVGLDPAFFVTSANVVLVGEPKKLTGETLYLSAPLLRILKPDELTAVVAHELGHFVGHDTIYSRRFAPIYAQLNHSLDRLSNIEHASDIAKLPGLALLSILMTIFASKERTIGRTRELEADRKAASIAPPEALISALVKIGLVARRWAELRGENIDALNKGTFLINLCQTFAETVLTMTDHDEAISRMLQALENERVSHPTDTHPTNAERATSLNVDINAVVNASFSELRQHLQSTDSHILSQALEEGLTSSEQRLLLQLGLAQLPPRPDVKDDERPKAANTEVGAAVGTLAASDEQLKSETASPLPDDGLPGFLRPTKSAPDTAS